MSLILLLLMILTYLKLFQLNTKSYERKFFFKIHNDFPKKILKFDKNVFN